MRQTAPDLVPLLTENAGEARFGLSVVASEVAALPTGSRLLEIGAGALLLSCGLRAAGYEVTAVEPTGSGFSHIGRLRRIVLDYAGGQGCAPDLYTMPAEDLDRRGEFDFAFSINVMEHVNDVVRVLQRVYHALRPGGAYRFVCPNYSFPYEPHFDIPTLFSKAATARVFQRQILNSTTIVDPRGTWDSLNWITVASVRQTCRRDLNLTPEFDRLATHRFVQRAIGDPGFQRRHHPLIRYACAALDAVALTHVVKFIPVAAQPVMSCRIVRPD